MERKQEVRKERRAASRAEIHEQETVEMGKSGKSGSKPKK
jgi:hypothetical protein